MSDGPAVRLDGKVTKENVAELVTDPDFMPVWRKTGFTRAIRVLGPFTCITSEGNEARCEDGYLVVDAGGHPYPCNREEFERSYAPAR